MQDATLTLDIHLPFSYWRQTDYDLDAPASRPQAASVLRYTRAVEAELASLGADVKGTGHVVGSVFFSGGYLGLLDPDDMRTILCAVHRCFDAAPKLRVEAVTFPGLLDMYAASTYVDEGLGAFMFEIPTLSAHEAEKTGLPNVLQAMDKSLNVLLSYGAGEFGMRMPGDVPGRTPATWEYLLGQVNHYSPLHVELVGLPQEGPSAEGLAAFRAGLERVGYRQAAASPSRLVFSRLVADPAYAAVACADQKTERLGVGLGAVTVMDGFRTRNTTDFDRYCRQSADYRNLIEDVVEL